MCDQPITHEGVTFACRHCNSCIAFRRSGWEARALAEKTNWPFAAFVTLTYDNSDQDNRDSAAMFNYHDVRAFFHRLKADAFRAHLRLERQRLAEDPDAKPLPAPRAPRFLVAGEQGSRFGRCHWHIVLFTDYELGDRGVFSDAKGRKLTGREVYASGKDLRLSWSLWGRGFVTVQEATSETISYGLAYALKEQFNSEKSRGTMREHKSEAFACGLFRTSKFPPIGGTWLSAKLAKLAEFGQVLPSLRLSVPGLSGYWRPAGLMRETLLWGLIANNQLARWRTGRNAPQWGSLLASVAETPADLEVLHGAQEQEHDDDPESDSAVFAREIRVKSGEERDRAIRKQCGGVLPCRACLNGMGREELDVFAVDRIERPDGRFFYADRLDAQQRAAFFARQGGKAGSLNSGCALGDAPSRKRAFFRASGSCVTRS